MTRKEEKTFYVYITTNKKYGTLYIGVTSNLEGRIFDHKEKIYGGFTQKYNLTKLVYYEIYDDVIEAISREKQLKNWHREWKINLINKYNSTWKDLYDDFCQGKDFISQIDSDDFLPDPEINSG